MIETGRTCFYFKLRNIAGTANPAGCASNASGAWIKMIDQTVCCSKSNGETEEIRRDPPARSKKTAACRDRQAAAVEGIRLPSTCHT
jgi:hypothetical protein